MKKLIRTKLNPKWPKGDVKPKWRDEFSDGCTLVPDVPETMHCCLAHDKAYYEANGGRKGRKSADEAFLKCMKDAGWTWRAYGRYFGVRVLGWFWWWT